MYMDAERVGDLIITSDGQAFKLVPVKPRNIRGNLFVRSAGKYTSLARLVARAHLKKPNMPNPVVMYKDGDPTNVSASNLVWVERPTHGRWGAKWARLRAQVQEEV